MKENKQVSQSRRRFLRDAGISGGVAAVAATGSGAALATTTADDPDKPKQEGYRLTKHILDYYKSAAS
jgi:hypothetical protein